MCKAELIYEDIIYLSFISDFVLVYIKFPSL